MGKFYRVIISEPNMFIIHKGRQLRTPVNIKIPESELELFKMKIRQLGINEYSIDDFSEETIKVDPVEIKEEIIVDESFESDDKPSSILDVLMKDQ